MEFCPRCGETVIWETTTAGVKIALNPEPQPLGMLYISSVDGRVKPYTKDIGRSVKRYESHSYNCPQAVEAEVGNEA